MHNVYILALVAITTVSINLAAQEPGTIPWTPKDAGGLRMVAIEVPPRYASVGLDPNVHRLRIPEGWRASVFFAGNGLNKARFMAWGPDSVLFVANMSGNNILALPDRDRNGVADTVIVAARGFSYGNDVRFHRDTMYVAQEAGIVKLWRSNASTYVFDQRRTVVDKTSQQGQTGGNHRTRTVVIDTVRNVFYLSIGSRGNADREADRALIEEYQLDGSGRRVYASGVRNAVGMTLHPRTGKLWANNNGSDNQGNNVPPEWVDIVRDGGFYGYPYAYHYRRFFNFTGDYQDLLPITAADSARLDRMSPPAALVDAHCAPMALVFTESTPVPEYRNGAFMAMRGSWNRNPPSGAKIVFLAFDDDADTIANVVRDFCTGFISDTNNVGTRWGRPVGLALSGDGSVYVSVDDGRQMILKITPPQTTSVNSDASSSIRIAPNPTTDACTIHLAEQGATIRVFTLTGERVADVRVEGYNATLSTALWNPGVYTVVVEQGNRLVSKTLTVVR